MWPFSKKLDPAKRLAMAEAKGEIPYCKEVCSLADEADSLFDSGTLEGAMELYRLVSEIETPNKGLGEVIEHCRCRLKAQGQSVPETASDIYAQHIASMPEHDRYVFLARERIRGLASGRDGIDKDKLKKEIIGFFERAQAIRPLGKKDQRIYLGLKGRV